MRYIFVKLMFMIIIFCEKSYGQINSLNSIRDKYQRKDNFLLYEKYKKYKLKQNKDNFPPLPVSGNPKYDKLVKFYTIPLKKRLEIYPFNVYDSIYFCTFNYIESEKLGDFLKSKYHNYKRLLSLDEIDKITNILFNYYKMQASNFREIGRGKTGCGNIYQEYPKMMLLFEKNGKFKDYIAFPDDGSKQTTFFKDKDIFEYWEQLDLCAEKEDLILKMFGFDREYN